MLAGATHTKLCPQPKNSRFTLDKKYIFKEPLIICRKCPTVRKYVKPITPPLPLGWGCNPQKKKVPWGQCPKITNPPPLWTPMSYLTSLTWFVHCPSPPSFTYDSLELVSVRPGWQDLYSGGRGHLQNYGLSSGLGLGNRLFNGWLVCIREGVKHLVNPKATER